MKWTNVHRGNNEFYEKTHSNPFYTLLFVTDGPVFSQVETEMLTLQAGESYLLSPWEKHWGWKEAEAHTGFFWVQFAADPILLLLEEHEKIDQSISLIDMKPDLRVSSEGNEVKLIVPKRMTLHKRFELSILFEHLVHEFQTPNGYYRVRMMTLLWNILEKMAHETLLQTHTDTNLPSTFVLYRKIVNYLDESYQQDLTKTVMETALDRKYEYICAVFKKYAGTTITTYMHHLRIQEAQHLLLTTSLTIGAIAGKVGYTDAYYFSKVFKKATTLSPQQYRDKKGKTTKSQQT